MQLNKQQQLKRAYFTFEWRRKYDATNWQRIMVLFFICILILVAVPLNLLGLSGPTGILFTALNLGQYAFTIGALSLLAFRVVKLRAALASILLMVQSFMVVEMLACSINPTSENVVLVLGDLFLSFGVIVLALAANYKILPFVLVALPSSAYISCTALIDNEMFTNFFPLIFMSFLLVPILGYMFVRNFQRLETEHIRMKDTERNVLDVLGIDKEKALEFIHTKKKGKINMLDFFTDSAIWKLRDEIERIGNEEKAALNRISAAIPGLTPSEVEIVQLILHGHKTSEICMMLGKEKGNITSQRTHIRAKLGLTDPRADLRSALIERIERQAQ